jgi:hypothetical protein
MHSIIITTDCNPLQDPLPAAVAAACPKAAGFVTTAAQLAAALAARPDVLGAPAGGVLVAGDGLDAFSALAALVDRGVDPGAITWVADTAGQAEAAAAGPGGAPLLARLLAKRLGLELPAPQQGRLQDVGVSADGARAVCSIEVRLLGAGGRVRLWGREAGALPCLAPPRLHLASCPQAPDGSQTLALEVDLVVAASGRRTPGPEVAAALEAAGLVVDGRAVVDGAFATADGAVLVAGPAAKFSR